MTIQRNFKTFDFDRTSALLLPPDRGTSDVIALSSSAAEEILALVNERERALNDLQDRVAELERLLETDELTGLLNRRGFEAAAQRSLSAATRYGEKGVLALIDLDGFKRVNDDYGHAAGDAALRLVGQILRENVRATDYAARLSGDEFAVLWVRAEPSAIARRLRELKSTLDSAALEWDEDTIAIKASVGTATYDSSTHFQDLVRRADKAMYRCKRARRKA